MADPNETDRGSDVFPEEYSDYWAIVQGIHSEVRSDAVTLRKRKEKSETTKHVTYGRSELAKKLADAHAAARSRTKSNAKFAGVEVTVGEIETALRNPSSYDSSEDWMAWAGVHEGRWYDTHNGKVCEDDATWYRPETESASEFPADTLHQDAHFEEPKPDGRKGWNESNPEADFVWGWDPKQKDPRTLEYDDGYVGTHVGSPFSKGEASCIVCLTPQVAFVEVVEPHPDLPRRLRTSATPDGWDWGYGQWSVKLRDGMLTPGGGEK
ncbi:hypothetical protein [Halorientalis pallida]|uniref:Uncharacterized protein n=1 Tax=Halorientalis pallida TaxID=2479928 RepID=A0A498L315_9EURY|nr:hypothetical protein [Halorientalis pallida]RXK49274.1 hypothetical protein EAF64_10170 [Halorientalis pallida]